MQTVVAKLKSTDEAAAVKTGLFVEIDVTGSVHAVKTDRHIGEGDHLVQEKIGRSHLDKGTFPGRRRATGKENNRSCVKCRIPFGISRKIGVKQYSEIRS